MNKKRPSLKINAASNWSALIIRVITAFFLTPFIISCLGKTEYGVWILVSSFIGYYSFLELGIGTAVTRYIARFSGKGDEKAQNEVAATSMAMLCLTGGVVVVISFFAGEPLARFFEIGPEYFNKFKWAICLMGLSIALNFPAKVIDAAIIAHEKYLPFNLVKICLIILRAGVIVLFLVLGKGLLGLAYAVLIVNLLHLAASRLLCRRVVPRLSFSLSSVRFAVSRWLITYGGVSTIIMVASIVQASIGNFITGKYLGAEYVAVFGIAMLLLRYFKQFITQATGVLRPRFAALEGACKHREMRNLFLKAVSNSALLAFGLGAMIIIMGGRFIVFWVGKDFAGAVPVLWILVFGYAFALAQSPGNSLLYALKKHHYIAILVAFETAAVIGLSIVLAPTYGLTGIASGITIPLLIASSFQVLYVSRKAQVKLREYIKAIGRPFLISAFTVLIAFSTGIITNYREFSVAASILYGLLFLALITGFSLSISDSVTRSLCSRLINRYMVPTEGK